MTYRKPVLANGEVYHIVARTIAKTPLFLNKQNYQRFLDTINFYRYKKPPLRLSHYLRLSRDEQENIINNLEKDGKFLVEIIAFCLMPNHVHFLAKQLEDNGVSIFMSRVQNSYAKYFNTKNKRVGSLFQSMFKAVRIEIDEQLVHVSRYIHLNPSSSYVCKIKDLKKYPWSSLSYYLNLKSFKFVTPNLVFDLFSDKQDYEKFVFDQASYQRRLAIITHLTLES